ncbi:hypothetical protein [Streptomyces sp. NPDC047928]|uniref:hypothetical protein n=1 Tax=unclassified Streptomyces TaxID=2593676 RepID=UPI00371F674F
MTAQPDQVLHTVAEKVRALLLAGEPSMERAIEKARAETPGGRNVSEGEVSEYIDTLRSSPDGISALDEGPQ